MIHIVDKSACVGCNGCASVCPTQCIELKADEEGFSYPVVDVVKCIDCGLCERVCPVLVQEGERVPLHTYAAVNNDNEVRVKSSSGGIFYPLAVSVIADGGVVFGAVFNDKWRVVHTHAQCIDELYRMRGSKYSQSEIGECYKLAKKFLSEGRRVLFTATPCQIAGLRRYLRKEYTNLICVDIICHGVPSPAVFNAYLCEEGERAGFDVKDIRHINFRDKREGWHASSFVYSYVVASGDEEKVHTKVENLYQNLYCKGFILDLYLRPSCHDCPSKRFKSGSDISIADLWGVEDITPELDDNRGTSLIFINSEVGDRCFESIAKEITFKEIPFVEAIKGNPQINSSAIESKNRKAFFQLFGKEDTAALIHKLTKASFKKKVQRRVKIAVKKIKKIVKI